MKPGNKNKKIVTSFGSALLALSLTGCVQFVGPGEEHGASQAEPSVAETSAPQSEQGEDQPHSWEDKVAAAKEKVSGGTSESAEPSSADGESELKEAKTIDLAPESGVQYVRAIQDWSPKFEQWVFDREKGEMTYKLVDCLGQSKATGSGAIEWTDAKGESDGFVAITWDGEPPEETLISRSRTTEYRIDDRVMILGGFGDTASVKTDVELDKFKGMCAGAGEMVVDFLL